LLLEKVHAVFALLHGAIARVTASMEQAMHLVAVHAGTALEALVVSILIMVAGMSARCIHDARINSPFRSIPGLSHGSYEGSRADRINDSG
jgi:hypothetical protein